MAGKRSDSNPQLAQESPSQDSLSETERMIARFEEEEERQHFYSEDEEDDDEEYR